jgi:hypothetical protein
LRTCETVSHGSCPRCVSVLQHDHDRELAVVEVPAEFVARREHGDLERIEWICAAEQLVSSERCGNERGHLCRFVQHRQRQVGRQQVVCDRALRRVLHYGECVVGAGAVGDRLEEHNVALVAGPRPTHQRLCRLKRTPDRSVVG